MKTVLLLALAGRRHVHALLDLLRPISKTIDAARCANDADAYLLGLYGPQMRSIKKETILGVGGGLPVGEFQRRLEQVQCLERRFGELHQGSSSGSGSPSVEPSCSSCSSVSWSGK
jgi:hypothetical protein